MGCIPNIELLLARGADLSIESKHGNAVDVGLRLWHADSVMEVFRKASFYERDKKAEKIWSSHQSRGSHRPCEGSEYD